MNCIHLCMKKKKVKFIHYLLVYWWFYYCHFAKHLLYMPLLLSLNTWVIYSWYSFIILYSRSVFLLSDMSQSVVEFAVAHLSHRSKSRNQQRNTKIESISFLSFVNFLDNITFLKSHFRQICNHRIVYCRKTEVQLHYLILSLSFIMSS